MNSKISVSVKGTTENNSGLPVSTMNISFDWEYNPIEMLKLMNEDGPELYKQFVLLFSQIANAAGNDNKPTGTAQQPFEAAHASTDGEGLDVELTVNGDGNVVVTPKD
jgi:hypothetical protein